MIDYLCRFASLAAAQTALPAYGSNVTPEGGGTAVWTWDGSSVLPTQVWFTNGTTLSGYVVWVSKAVVDNNLAALTQMLEIDRELKTGTLWTRSIRRKTFTQAQIDTVAMVSPVWMGADYGLPGLPVV